MEIPHEARNWKIWQKIFFTAFLKIVENAPKINVSLLENHNLIGLCPIHLA